jgi:hypothetical protein
MSKPNQVNQGTPKEELDTCASCGNEVPSDDICQACGSCLDCCECDTYDD